MPKSKKNNSNFGFGSGLPSGIVPFERSPLQNRNTLNLTGIDLLGFIEDKRLVGWYLQNFDLCRSDYSNVAALDKLHFWPIGVNFHSDRLQTPEDQEKLLLKTASNAPRWENRARRVLANFEIKNAERLAARAHFKALSCAYGGLSLNTPFRRPLMRLLGVP